MAIDREAAVKKAEKFLRQGKLASAIEEYVRLIDEQPGDWNAINALGDLYLRAGDPERAVAQFSRVADHLLTEGFLPRASALYKKVLKVQPRHEHTLSRLAEITTRQGLLADAASYLRQLLDERRSRGDEQGVSEVVAQLRALDDENAKPAAGPPVRRGFTPPPPANRVVAEQPLPETPADEPTRLFELARTQLFEGDELQGRATLTRALAIDPARHSDALQLAFDLVSSGRAETGFGCIDVITDAAVLEGDQQRAVHALQAFIERTPNLAASIKLVDLCVDAGLEEPLRIAQAQLADAYLHQGSGAEAKVIAEDLLEQEPASELHAERLRQALTLLSVRDPEATVREVRGRRSALTVDELTAEPETGIGHPPTPLTFDTTEIDLTAALATLESMTPVPMQGDPGETLHRAMEQMRAGRVEEALASLQEAAAQPRTRARAAAELGRLYSSRGDLASAVRWFEVAADGPAPTQADAFAVLYDLADTLARLGESSRALAILLDLDAEAGEYRDVRRRIEQLAGGNGL